MHKQAWARLFFITLLIHLSSIQLQWLEVRFITKPLLVLILLSYFLTQVKKTSGHWKISVAVALFFSWLGDVLLLFEAKGSIFFLLGLVSFLIAHLFYIFFFNKVHKEEGNQFKALLLVGVVAYYAALIGLLHSRLGGMKGPVYIYGLVICAMLLQALHLYKVREQYAGTFFLLGALLFVISDSVLAINKFYQSFSGASIVIMLTYGIAQWLITEGAVRWMQAKQLKEAPILIPNGAPLV